MHAIHIINAEAAAAREVPLEEGCKVVLMATVVLPNGRCKKPTDDELTYACCQVFTDDTVDDDEADEEATEEAEEEHEGRAYQRHG